VVAAVSYEKSLETAMFYENHPAYSATVGDRVVVCAGIVVIWPGLGMAWVNASDEIKRFPKAFHVNVMGYMTSIIREQRLRRVQCEVLSADDVACRWVTRIGFQPESIMPLYGPNGETFMKYVLFPKGVI
jgi:hypothetical protein